MGVDIDTPHRRAGESTSHPWDEGKPDPTRCCFSAGALRGGRPGGPAANRRTLVSPPAQRHDGAERQGLRPATSRRRVFHEADVGRAVLTADDRANALARLDLTRTAVIRGLSRRDCRGGSHLTRRNAVTRTSPTTPSGLDRLHPARPIGQAMCVRPRGTPYLALTVVRGNLLGRPAPTHVTVDGACSEPERDPSARGRRKSSSWNQRRLPLEESRCALVRRRAVRVARSGSAGWW